MPKSKPFKPSGNRYTRSQHGYSQAVRLGDRIECAGQGKKTPTNTMYAPKKESLTLYSSSRRMGPEDGRILQRTQRTNRPGLR
jgi:hypothetical protein